MEYEEDVYVDILDESPVDKGKGNVDISEFDRWDGGGSLSGVDESDHFYSRYRNEGGECGGSYKVRSVVEKGHEAENEGVSLSSRHPREAESDEEGEEKFLGRHVKRGSGDKVHKRNYRRRNVVDRDLSDEEDGGQFMRKVKMHGSEDKEHQRNYRSRKVVDDDYSNDNVEGKELFAEKFIMHVSVDKERGRNYRRKRVVDDDSSDDKAKEEQFTRKVSIHGSEDKEHKRIYRHRRVVDDDYSEDEEERQVTSKLHIRRSGEKRHKKDSKRRRVAENDCSDDDFEFAARRSKERDDSGSQDWHSRKILPRRHSRSRDEKMSEDHVKKDIDRSRQRDDSHERKKDHQRDKYLKDDWYDKEDKYKRELKDTYNSTRMSNENYDEDDNWERGVLRKEREYGHKRESRRSAGEENFDRRLDMHHSARYPNEHGNDYDWEMGIMEGKRDYVYTKEHRNDAKEDKHNRTLKGTHQSTRYQTERDDDDWEKDMMEGERGSWECGREINDYNYEMKHIKREKDQDFRGHDKESLSRTSLVERGKEEDAREQGGDFWENQEINRHAKSRLGNRETSYVRRDLRIQIIEAKEMSRRRELTDVENERDSMEQRTPSLDVSLQRDFEESQKVRDFRGRDTEYKGKSKDSKRNKEDKEESWKSILSESTINKWDREPRGKICERDKIHKVIRKKDLTERNVTSMEDSHRRKWDRKMGKMISERDFCEKDSKKHDMEHLLHVAKESDSDDYNIRSREMSQETEWDRKTRQKYQKTEFMSREKQGREGRHNMSERDGVLRQNEKILKKKNEEKKEEHHDRGFNKRRETTRRDYVEKGTWNPDTEIREKSSEMEIMHKRNERNFMTSDVLWETSHQMELLNKPEGKSLRESDKLINKKTLENDSEDNENRRDLITWDADMEKIQRKELLNKEKDKSRRDSAKRSLENSLEDKSVEKENGGNSVVHDSVCWEKSKQTTQGESVRDLQKEEEKCRKHLNESKVEDAETDLGTESERQQKTIFAYQISTQANDRDVYGFFSQAGKVRDVRLVMDPILGHFIGVGYIEFYRSMSIPIAVSLSGKLLHDQPVMVKLPQADGTLVNSAKNAVENDIRVPCPVRSNRLCVGNLHDIVSEALLRQVFGAFGTIELVQFDSPEAGHCDRKCIIQFTRLVDACAALSLNGHLALAGQLIKVSPVTVSDHDEVQVVSVDTNGCHEAVGKDMGSDSNIGIHNELLVVRSDTNGCNEAEGIIDLVPDSCIGGGQNQNEVREVCAHTNCCNEAEGIDMMSDGLPNELLESDARTSASNEKKGTELFPDGQPESASQKLEPCGVELNKSSSPVNDDSLTLPSESLEHLVPPPSIQAFVNALKAVLQAPGAAIPIVDTVGIPSECLHLKNMFDSNIQVSEEFDLRVKEDVEEHCYKFGKPKEIYIEKNSAGYVYLRFKDTQTAIVAQRALHGRWFGGKMITATYMEPRIYDAKFPKMEQASFQEQPPPAWLPHNYSPNFPISGQTLAQGPTPAVWQPQTYGSNFPAGQQPLPPGPTAMWLPNNSPVAFGAGFGNGGQFMQPLVPQGNTFPDMRTNV